MHPLCPPTCRLVLLIGFWHGVHALQARALHAPCSLQPDRQCALPGRSCSCCIAVTRPPSLHPLDAARHTRAPHLDHAVPPVWRRLAGVAAAARPLPRLGVRVCRAAPAVASPLPVPRSPPSARPLKQRAAQGGLAAMAPRGRCQDDVLGGSDTTALLAPHSPAQLQALPTSLLRACRPAGVGKRDLTEACRAVCAVASAGKAGTVLQPPLWHARALRGVAAPASLPLLCLPSILRRLLLPYPVASLVALHPPPINSSIWQTGVQGTAMGACR